MKTILFISLSLLFISCGKSSSDTSNRQLEHGRGHQDDYLDISSNPETELLNVSVNTMVDLTEDTISFSQSVFVQDQGQRINCLISIPSGEIWHLRRNANYLELDFPNGQRKRLKSLSSDSNGHKGVWIWSGMENGVQMIKRYTFLSQRLIINQDCEG